MMGNSTTSAPSSAETVRTPPTQVEVRQEQMNNEFNRLVINQEPPNDAETIQNTAKKDWLDTFKDMMGLSAEGGIGAWITKKFQDFWNWIKKATGFDKVEKKLDTITKKLKDVGDQVDEIKNAAGNALEKGKDIHRSFADILQKYIPFLGEGGADTTAKVLEGAAVGAILSKIPYVRFVTVLGRNTILSGAAVGAVITTVSLYLNQINANKGDMTWEEIYEKVGNSFTGEANGLTRKEFMAIFTATPEKTVSEDIVEKRRLDERLQSATNYEQSKENWQILQTEVNEFDTEYLQEFNKEIEEYWTDIAGIYFGEDGENTGILQLQKNASPQNKKYFEQLQQELIEGGMTLDLAILEKMKDFSIDMKKSIGELKKGNFKTKKKEIITQLKKFRTMQEGILMRMNHVSEEGITQTGDEYTFTNIIYKMKSFFGVNFLEDRTKWVTDNKIESLIVFLGGSAFLKGFVIKKDTVLKIVLSGTLRGADALTFNLGKHTAEKIRNYQENRNMKKYARNYMSNSFEKFVSKLSPETVRSDFLRGVIDKETYQKAMNKLNELGIFKKDPYKLADLGRSFGMDFDKKPDKTFKWNAWNILERKLDLLEENRTLNKDHRMKLNELKNATSTEYKNFRKWIANNNNRSFVNVLLSPQGKNKFFALKELYDATNPKGQIIKILQHENLAKMLINEGLLFRADQKLIAELAKNPTIDWDKINKAYGERPRLERGRITGSLRWDIKQLFYSANADATTVIASLKSIETDANDLRALKSEMKKLSLESKMRNLTQFGPALKILGPVGTALIIQEITNNPEKANETLAILSLDMATFGLGMRAGTLGVSGVSAIATAYRATTVVPHPILKAVVGIAVGVGLTVIGEEKITKWVEEQGFTTSKEARNRWEIFGYITGGFAFDPIVSHLEDTFVDARSPEEYFERGHDTLTQEKGFHKIYLHKTQDKEKIKILIDQNKEKIKKLKNSIEDRKQKQKDPNYTERSNRLLDIDISIFEKKINEQKKRITSIREKGEITYSDIWNNEVERQKKLLPETILELEETKAIKSSASIKDGFSDNSQNMNRIEKLKKDIIRINNLEKIDDAWIKKQAIELVILKGAKEETYQSIAKKTTKKEEQLEIKAYFDNLENTIKNGSDEYDEIPDTVNYFAHPNGDEKIKKYIFLEKQIEKKIAFLKKIDLYNEKTFSDPKFYGKAYGRILVQEVIKKIRNNNTPQPKQ